MREWETGGKLLILLYFLFFYLYSSTMIQWRNIPFISCPQTLHRLLTHPPFGASPHFSVSLPWRDVNMLYANPNTTPSSLFPSSLPLSASPLFVCLCACLLSSPHLPRPRQIYLFTHTLSFLVYQFHSSAVSPQSTRPPSIYPFTSFYPLYGCLKLPISFTLFICSYPFLYTLFKNFG